MKLNPEIKLLNSETRLYGFDKPIVGLTGGIATGKSTVTKILRDRGLAVICADELVKKIYQDEQILTILREKAPTAITQHQVNFKELRKIFFSDKELKKILSEAIYQHLPHAFLSEARKHSLASFIIYDVPLLFEKGLQLKVDTNCLIYSSVADQRARISQRDGTDDLTIDRILSEQLPIDSKRKMAEIVVENTKDREFLNGQVTNWLTWLTKA